MDNEKKRVFKKQLWLSLSLIISLLIVTVSASYSWFLYQQPNMAYDVKVEVMDTFNLTLKSGEQGDDKITSNLGEDFRLQPVYGNGKNFYLPQFDNVEIPDRPGEYVFAPTGKYDPLTNDQYEKSVFHMDFILGVEGFVDLYLEHSDHEKTRTFVAMGNGHENRKSPYGEFSRDNINGAVRVAIIQQGEVKCIWIPNTTVELKKENDKYSVLVDDAAEIEPTYTFMTTYDSKEEKMYSREISTNGSSNGHCVVDGVTYIWGNVTDGNCPKITTLYGEQAFSIVMWIDGTDRECDNALVGGKVQLNLCFAANKYGEGQEE